MPQPRRLPSKLSPPYFTAAIQRARLFALLDRHGECPATWISGQPGAGKTVLVATYLDSIQARSYWYQLDSNDADPASLFHYLRQLAVAYHHAKNRLDTDLPPLTPEYIPDAAGFSRRWFRRLFELLPPRCTLVFDNYQEVPGAALIHSLLRDVIDEVPRGSRVVFISSGAPPAEYARHITHGSLAVLDGSELRMTLDEVRNLCARYDTADPDFARTLLEQTQGWIAGTALLLAARQNGSLSARVPAERSIDVLFDYLSEFAFKRFTPDEQSTLRMLCLLPAFNVAQAIALTGRADMRDLLTRMCSKRLFIDARGVDGDSFQLHSLFRSFLLHEVRNQIDSAEFQSLQGKAGWVLEQSLEFEAAYDLYANSQSWDACVRCLLSNAPSLFRQGRWQTVQGWIDALPPTVRESTPWIRYWQASCYLAVSPADATSLYGAAYDTFERDKDHLGCQLSAAGAASAIFYQYTDFNAAKRWIDVLADQLARCDKSGGSDAEFLILSNLLILLIYHDPTNTLLPAYVTRLGALLDAPVPVAMKVATAAFMLHSASWTGDYALAERLMNRVTPLASDVDVPPLYVAWWNIAISCNGNLCGAPERSLESARTAVASIERHNLLSVRDKALLYYMYSALANEDVSLADSLAQDLVGRLDASRPMEFGMFRFLQSWLELLRNNLDAALRFADESIETCSRVGVPYFHLHALISRALLLNEMGRFEEALRCIAQMGEIGRSQESALFKYTIGLIEAEALYGSGDSERGKRALSYAIEIGSRNDQRGTAQWVSTIMARVCARAFEHGIGVGYVTRLVRFRGLRAPDIVLDYWPWPIKIHSLGRFEILLGDVRHASHHKSPRRVLQLLRTLIAQGRSGVSSDVLADLMWPDLDGDDTQRNLKVCIHRLRKLLGSDDTVIVQEGRVRLDYDNLWCDALAFEKLADSVLDRTFNWADASQLNRYVRLLMRLYLGEFMPDETGNPLISSARERLRTKFRRVVICMGTELERQQAHTDAIELYERGLGQDPLCEDMYQRLISCLLLTGKQAEAVNAYRRCRDMLSIVLGVAPSKETQALIRNLQQ